MKLRLVIAVAVVLLGRTQLGVAKAATNGLATIHTNFVTNAILSVDDLTNVVKLAKQCGMGEVAGVKTFYFLPKLGSRGILVTGPEKVDGRKITFQTLVVQREGWSYALKPSGSGPLVKAVGQFWVEGERPLEFHELTTFVTPKGIIRVSVKSGIDIETADKIIRAFTTGRIQYQNHSVIPKGNIDFADFSNPDTKPDILRESITNEHYWISFSNSYHQYEFVLNGDEVNILSVVNISY